MHDDRVVVALVDARDDVVADGTWNIVFLVEDRVPGKDDVVGPESFAVLPLHATTQAIDDRPAVTTDPAVAQRRHRGREFGHELVSVVIVEEIAAPEVRELGIDLLIADERIERIGFGEVDDPQQPVMGPGIARMRATLRLRDARAARRERQNEQRECERPHYGRTRTLIAERSSIAV